MPDPLNIIAVFCLSIAAGFNSLLVLVLLGVMARVGMIALESPLRGIPPMVLFGVITPLLMLEITLDKTCAAGRILGRIQIVIQPAVAAVIVVAFCRGVSGSVSLPVVDAIAVGAAALALVIHIIKWRARPVVAEVTQGIGVPVMSMLEDLVAAVLTVAAVISPVLALAFAGVSGYLFYRVLRKMQAQKRRLAANGAESAVPVVAVPMPRNVENVPSPSDPGKRGSVSP